MPDVRVFFATNRNYVDGTPPSFGKSFNPDGGAALRFGFADFQSSPTRPALKDLTVYPDVLNEPDINKTGGGMFMNDLRALMAGDGTRRTDTVVFIHGFNVSFQGALEAGAHLGQSLKVGGRPVNIVVFSWPSDGEAVPWMSYYSDREDARNSGAAVARAFLKLRQYIQGLTAPEYCQQCIHLLAHSMGNYVLRQGLQALIKKDPTALVRVFDQIVMAAPDEDDDAFETPDKLKYLPNLGRRVTLYFNPKDKALLISDKTKANPDRLGSDGTRLVDTLPGKLTLVDCRAVAGDADPHVEHSYYIRSRAMTRDINAVLADTPLDEIPNRLYVERSRCWRIEKETGVKPVAVPPPTNPANPG